LRLAAVVCFSGMPVSGGGDDTVYCALAQSVRSGQGFSVDGRPCAQRGPAYPLFLAAAGGRDFSPDRARFAQIFISCAAVVIAGFATGAAFGPLAGWCCAALLALNPEQILLPTSLYCECFLSLLLALLLAVFFRWSRVSDRKNAALCGVVLGICALCRSFFLPFGILAAWAVLRRAPVFEAKKQSAVFTVLLFGCLLPWVVRDYRVFHRLLPIEAGVSGPVFYYASEGYITAPAQEDGEEPFKTVAHTLPHWEWDGAMYRYAWPNIAAQPFRYIKTSVSRAWYLWDETYVAYLLFYNPAWRGLAVDKWQVINLAGKIFLFPLFVLAFYGFWLHRAKTAAWIALGLLLYFNCYALFAVFVRFAAPAAIPLAVLAGAGIAGLIRLCDRFGIGL